MTLEQVTFLRDQLNKDNGKGKAVANSVFYDLDNNMAMRNNGDFVIFDDDKQLIHCIAANRNNYVKDETPYCIISSAYEHLQFTEGNLTLDGLYNVLDNMLSGLIDDTQKEMIKTWALKIPVNPISPVVSSYLKEPNPEVNYRPVTVVTRPDGVSNGYPVSAGSDAQKPIKAVPVEKASDSIANAKEGDTIAIGGSKYITQPISVTTDGVTICGGNMDNPVTVSGNKVTLDNIAFTNNSLDSDNKSEHMLTATGDDITISDCIFSDNGSYIRNGVSVQSSNVVIKNTSFYGNGGCYNAYESKYGTDTVIKSMTIENCVFEEGASTNNFVSMYNFEDGAVVEFKNCVFKQGVNTNAIRLSNLSNTHATINLTDCKFTTRNVGEYAGLILLQDPTKEKSEDFSLFTINIKNLTKNGKVIKENGTGADTVWYTYNTDTVPTVNFL